MLDYSKWDSLDVSDDERPRPQVSKFETPQTVTIGQAQAASDAMEEDGDDEPFETEDDAWAGEDRREDVLQCRALGERALRSGDVAEGIRLLEKAMRLGGDSCPGLEDTLRAACAMEQAAPVAAKELREERPQLNGGMVEDRYAWSQNKETVEINLFVPEDAKAKDMKVDVSETHLNISMASRPLLCGEWEFKVAPEEDPDWELKSCHGRRALRLQVRKAAMPGGMSVAVWWSRVLKGEPAIDVKGIEGRKRDRDKSEEFQKAWSDAHAMFKESVKNRQPILIPTEAD
ncbi:unnamed protein product [Effrenium voratum]|nr:unnamed protein product [Effrenium voratum]